MKNFRKNIVDKNFHEIFNKSFLIFFIRVLAMFSSYAFTLIITSFYGITVMGYFAFSQKILFLSSIFSRLGLDVLSVKLVSEYFYKDDYSTLKFIYNKILSIVITSGLLISTVLFFTYYFLENNFKIDSELAFHLKLSAIAILPLTLIYVHSESFRGMKKILFYSLLTMMSLPLISSIILLFLYYLDISNTTSPILSYFFSIIILSTISFFLWNRNIKSISKSKVDSSNFTISKLLKKSIPLSIIHIILFSLQSISIIILGLFVDMTEIGSYEIAFKLSLIINVVFFSVNGISMPKYAELYSKNSLNELKDVAKYSSFISILVATPIFLLLVLFSKQILLIFGDDVLIAKNAFIILSLAQYFNILTGSVQQILQMTDDEVFFRNIIVFSLIINIILNFIFIPIYGITGSSFIYLITIIIWKFLGMIRIKRKLDFWTFSYKIVK